MPGKRDRNLRSGNIHEDLGVLLLRPVALVAPVPLWEDVGLDAAATLLRPEGGRRLIPEDAFGVQLKASSVRTISYEDADAAAWVINLGIPFFVGSIRLGEAAIDLIPTHALFHVAPHAGLNQIHLHLDPHDQILGATEIAHVCLGPPALSWSTDDLADPEFPAKAYPVLKGHIQAAQRNIQNRQLGYCAPLIWETGKPPVSSGTFTMQSTKDGDISLALTEMMAPFRKTVLEVGLRQRLDVLPGLFEFIKAVRALGTDLDPSDAMIKTALSIGPLDTARRDMIHHLLQQGMSPVRFFLQGESFNPLDANAKNATGE